MALAAVIIATAILTAVMSITFGQDRHLRRLLVRSTPHAVVLPERTAPLVPQQLFTIDSAVIELVVNTPPSDRREIKPRVEVATRARRSNRAIAEVAPFVLLHGVLRNGARYRAVEIRGVDPKLERGIGRAHSGSQSFAALRSREDATIIGRGLAERLGVRRINETLTLITASGVIRRLTVAGVFQSDLRALDNERAFVGIELAQELHRMPRNAVTGLSVVATDPAEADAVARSVERAIGYRTLTWERASGDVVYAHRGRMIATWLAAAALVLMAAMSMANVQLASLLFPGNDDAVGRDNRPFTTLIARGMTLGAIGGVIGVAIGVLSVIAFVASGYVAPSFVADAVRMRRTPASFAPLVLIVPGVTAFVLVSAASLIPAWQAYRRARLSPRHATGTS